MRTTDYAESQQKTDLGRNCDSDESTVTSSQTQVMNNAGWAAGWGTDKAANWLCRQNWAND